MEKKFFFACKALIINNNKFLALYNKVEGKKLWDLPGGRMEFGESAEETLKREVYEELGVTVKPIKLVDTWNLVGDMQITGIIYYCDVDSMDFKLSHEHEGYEWIDINHLSESFTAKIFQDRMKRWNWDAIVDNTNTILEL